MFSASSASSAFIVYVLMTLALTWPVARGLTRDVPSDFGDPVFVMWVLSWDVTHLGRGLWHANIFYPHQTTLAYSEHFLPQALQILPIYALTANPILCYNLLFLSTFVLSGLGMFLLVRELTGNVAAAFVGGVAFAFCPYRIASLPHPQVLSSAWLPFVLFGLRRYFDTGRSVPLAWAAGAWIVQNLSCGYYFFFFSPVVLLYVAWEITTRRLWTNAHVLAAIAVTLAATLALTVPFLLPYLSVRQEGFTARSAAEVDRFSADVYSYLTAPANLHLWGGVARAWPKSEGALFPGMAIVVLAAIAIVAARRRAGFGRGPTLAWGAAKLVLVALLLGWTLRLPGVKIASFGRALVLTLGALAVWLATSRRARSWMDRWFSEPAAIFAIVTTLGMAMSFGMRVLAKGRVILDPGPYAFFYRFVPGADGLRVPARFAMVVSFGLAALAGLAVAAVPAQRRRVVAIAAAGLMCIEFLAVPLPMNGNSTVYERPGLAPLPDRLEIGAAAPPVYHFVGTLPSTAVMVELPLGEPAFDIRYMFYSTLHWKPLVNGYSGGTPPGYDLLDRSLQDAAARPDRAWRALVDSGATHVIVHEGLYADGRGPQMSAWVADRGGREIALFGSDRVFQMR